MIKEATVKIDGLTVIAGENDTGKSTVGKALFNAIANVKGLTSFENQLFLGNNEEKPTKAIFIDTPNSLDIFSFVKNATLLIHQEGLNIHLPKYRIDLILRLSQDITETKETFGNNLYRTIESLIDGRVFYDKNRDDILYEKYSKDKRFKMEKTSNGIKMFGFLQMLLLNKTLEKNSVLILDEPEVHLHPKWQLSYAKIIVALVQKGIKVLVNSHSPYMIEALKRYSEVEKIEEQTNFYLAEDGYIKQENDSNSETLVTIYEKLSEPYDAFEEMEAQRMESLING